MWDGLHIVKHVLDAGVTIKVLDFPSLDLATPEGRGFLAMFSAMAERERTRIIERTREGRRIAMHRRVKMGPPFKLTEHQRNFGSKAHGCGREYPADRARFQRHDCTSALMPWAMTQRSCSRRATEPLRVGGSLFVRTQEATARHLSMCCPSHCCMLCV
jgi:hypothetical protein